MFRGKAEKKVVAAGYDPARLPPGQYLTEKWPVLHAGDEATYPADLSGWDFTVSGEVDTPLTLTWEQLSELPRVEVLRPRGLLSIFSALPGGAGVSVSRK